MKPTREAFDAAVQAGDPGAELLAHPCVLAMFHDALGDWDAAHDCVQDFAVTHQAASWVHGYLHLKEGDLRNARYWYDSVGRELTTESCEGEREAILAALLA